MFLSHRARLTAEQTAGNVDLTGKNVVITGASAGLGVETARVLAEHNAAVYMVGRDKHKLESVAADLNAKLKSKTGKLIPQVCDQSSLHNVHSWARTFKSLSIPIHILICNAGVLAPPYGLTKDGIDLQMGVNHVSHQLIVTELKDALLAGKPSRVVVLSSVAHRGKRIDFKLLPSVSEKQYKGWTAYQQAKLANLLFSYELNKRFPSDSITSYSLHPGVINTALFNTQGSWWRIVSTIASPFWKNVPQGAATTVYCAVTPGIERDSGKYFVDNSVTDVTQKMKYIDEDAKQLWEWTENIIADKLNNKSTHEEAQCADNNTTTTTILVT